MYRVLACLRAYVLTFPGSKRAIRVGRGVVESKAGCKQRIRYVCLASPWLTLALATPMSGSIGALAPLKNIMLLLLLASVPLVTSDIVKISYQCSAADILACKVERQQCINFPRPWLRQYDQVALCKCWKQSYACYRDCNNFPPDFQISCSAVCGKDTCQPSEGSWRPA